MINLFYNYFTQNNNRERQAEINYCFKMLLDNRLIDIYYIFVNSVDNRVMAKDFDLNSDHCFISVDENIPTFKNYFNLAEDRSKEDDLNIIINSDCYIDEIDLELIIDNIQPDQVWTLSRWDILNMEPFEAVHFDVYDSQDCWVFNGTPKPGLDVDFAMGKPGCDNSLAFELEEAGYKLRNPSKDVKVYHYHLSNVRTFQKNETERAKNRVWRPYYTLIPPHGLIDLQRSSKNG